MNSTRLIVDAPKNMPKFNSEYGLWIFGFKRGSVTEPLDFLTTAYRSFLFYDISHFYDGQGLYCDENGRETVLKKGDAIIIPPKYQHKYGGFRDSFCEDAISFCGPVADAMFRAGMIRAGVVHLGATRRLLPVIEWMLDNTRESQLKANIELQKLLLDLHCASHGRTGKSAVPDFIDHLLREIKATPDHWWNVECMAELCNLSYAHFTRLFKQHTGTTPKNYIDEVKMQIALEMLSCRNLTVARIAQNLGYTDPYHFSRRFRQIKGYWPEHYREQFVK